WGEQPGPPSGAGPSMAGPAPASPAPTARTRTPRMPHAARARRPLARLAAGAAAAVLLLAGCSGLDPAPDDDPTGSGDPTSGDGSGETSPALEETGTSAAQGLAADPAEDPAYAEYYEQSIDWGPCEDVEG